MSKKQNSHKLITEYFEESQFTETLLREVWMLRIELLDLRKSKEEDWVYFNDILSRPNTGLMLARDTQGKLQGFYSMAYYPIEHQGRKALLAYSKYLYFRKAYRGSAKVLTATLGLLPHTIKKHGFRRIYFTVSAYQQSYTFFTRVMGEPWTMQSKNLPQWERYVLDQFATTMFGSDWDKEKHLIANNSVPDLDVAHRTDEISRSHECYEKLNPHWQEGYTMLLMARIDHHTLLRTVRLAVSRQLRRLQYQYERNTLTKS